MRTVGYICLPMSHHALRRIMIPYEIAATGTQSLYIAASMAISNEEAVEAEEGKEWQHAERSVDCHKRLGNFSQRCSVVDVLVVDTL